MQNQGKIIFGITDAAASMGNISSVFVTVTKAQIHSSTSGWVTISDQTKKYDLLSLKKSWKKELFGQENVRAETYDQMRLSISKTTVVESGTEKEAKLPSGELKIAAKAVITPQSTSTVILDFIADESLHKTGKGIFIFAQNNTTFGMDVNGEVKLNFVLDTTNTTIDVVNNVLTITAKGESDKNLKITSDP